MFVKTADSELLEADVFLEDLPGLVRVDLDHAIGFLRHFESEDCLLVDQAEVLSACVRQCFDLLYANPEYHLARSKCNRENFSPIQVFVSEEFLDGFTYFRLFQSDWLARGALHFVVNENDLYSAFYGLQGVVVPDSERLDSNVVDLGES